jgi:hypothetical protein
MLSSLMVCRSLSSFEQKEKITPKHFSINSDFRLQSNYLFTPLLWLANQSFTSVKKPNQMPVVRMSLAKNQHFLHVSITVVLTVVVHTDISENLISAVSVSAKKQMLENSWVFANPAGNSLPIFSL